MDSPPNTARPTWLNQLPDHSIFELDEQEYLEWTQQNSTTTSATKDNKTDDVSKGSLASRFSFKATTPQTKDSFGLDDLKEEYQGAYQGLSCMAVRGQDMYVAIGRQIRYTSLGDLKKGVENHGRDAAIEYIDSRQHKVLKVQDVDFEIRRLVLNQEGKLLAIVGDEKIVIAALSKSIKQDPKPVVNCKSFVLGEFYHINKGEAKVVKVLWHPLSKGFTHLLVLTHDGLVRMYDVAVDIDEPEQVFSFMAEGITSNSYGMDVIEMASFCFGSKYSPWGQLAVYGLTRDGELYLLCPVMPQSCLLRAADLSEIRRQISESTQDGSLEAALVKQEWINKVIDSAQPHPFSEVMVMVQNPDLKSAKVSRQGPFLYQPTPIDLDDDDNRPYDILCLENEAAEVIAMAHSSGKVDICIAIDRPTGHWLLPRKLRSNGTYALDDDEEEDELPVVSVYESVDLGLLKVFATTTASPGYGLGEKRMSIPNRPVLVADTMYGDTFYIYHEAGAHCISIRPWLDELTAIYESAGNSAEQDARINKFYDSNIKSVVGSVVNTRPTKASPAAPVIGFSVVTDAYLDYSILLLTSSLQLIGMELTPRPRTGAISTSGIATPSTSFPGSSTTTAKVEAAYQISLPEPLFEKQAGLMSLNGLPLQPQVVLPPGIGSAKIVVTEENLQFLGKMVQGIRESLREVFTSCDLAQQRLVIQEAEYARQQDKVQKTREHIEKTLVPKTQKQADRVDEQLSRQRALMARADELLQKVMESREPALSPAEREWMGDVAKTEKVVKALSERRSTVEKQYDILKRRLADMQRQLDRGDIGQGESEDAKRRFSQSLLTRSGSPDFAQSWSPRRSSTVVTARPPVKRYGAAQVQPIQAALQDQMGMLDTTTKMVKELESRMEAMGLTKNLDTQCKPTQQAGLTSNN
ncbi:hypothetical protein BGX33_000557 [Mortierella sp. NVP41]|nr:hypothetical protein BGX33_000557 [Mortierella sp. NVP41]